MCKELTRFSCANTIQLSAFETQEGLDVGEGAERTPWGEL